MALRYRPPRAGGVKFCHMSYLYAIIPDRLPAGRIAVQLIITEKQESFLLAKKDDLVVLVNPRQCKTKSDIRDLQSLVNTVIGREVVIIIVTTGYHPFEIFWPSTRREERKLCETVVSIGPRACAAEHEAQWWEIGWQQGRASRGQVGAAP